MLALGDHDRPLRLVCRGIHIPRRLVRACPDFRYARRQLTAPAPGSYGIFASSALAGQSLCRTSRPSSSPFPSIYFPPLLLMVADARTPSPRRAGNLMGMAFPLFTEQMFARLTYHWGNTLFGCIAIAMIPIPFVRLLVPRTPWYMY